MYTIIYFITDSKKRVYFIGGSDAAKEGSWEWVGSKTALGFTDWGSNQPGDKSPPTRENCLALGGHDWFRWHDYPCEDKLRFICAVQK